MITGKHQAHTWTDELFKESNGKQEEPKNGYSKMLLKRTNGLENIVPPYMSSSVFCDQNGHEKKCPMVSSNHSKATAEVGNSEDNKKVLNRSI